MLLHDQQTNSLVKILDLEALFNPVQNTVCASSQAGEEEQSPKEFSKDRLNFPSGEKLPQCWMDADYRKPH
ncbi:conserved hypothetical protein [Gloeothece citriformis PCC 7424]|uniref:Acetyltransferase n=1 Tax=Gloeothece citriformis (strain PCC 7424) TaxID=65393 RepID=B7KGA1_GLOC7|nr:hypothetical protein [Gloeothece citriformis]ACK70572.1 conserved hypothetical protein [Gloeothece citriformis PCC 7424]